MAPHTLCSQSYIGPQLLQPPLTQQAAPPFSHTGTLLPSPWSSSISMFVWLCVCLRQVPLRALSCTFLSAPLSIDISSVSSTSLTSETSVLPFHLFDRTLNAFSLPTITSVTWEHLVWAHSLPVQPVTAESHHNGSTEQLVPCVCCQEAERDE